METFLLNKTTYQSLRFTGTLVARSSHTVRDIRAYLPARYQMVTWSLYRTANSGKYILHREECELQNSSGEENVQIDVCEDAKGILLLLARNKEALPFTSNELLIQAGASDPDFASYAATVVEDID